MTIDQVMQWLRAYLRRPSRLSLDSAREVLFVETGTYVSADHWQTIRTDLLRAGR